MMKKKEKTVKHPALRYWGKFIFRSILYFAIIFLLVYLYHYKNISGGTFIYNEF